MRDAGVPNRRDRRSRVISWSLRTLLAGGLVAVLPVIMSAVHPNPFSESTEFQLSIPHPGSKIKIDVYNIRGIHVRNLWPGYEGADPQDHPPGEYPIPWDGKDKFGDPVVSGIYICVLYANQTIVKSVKVIKIDK